MAVTQNPAARPESKSSKKKKAKADSVEAAVAAPAVSTPAESNDGSYESPYIKELYKSIRNVSKKITNASRVDNILAENPDSSLDDLVASKKINADQKAQILKKPALQASLTQLEEQIAQYKKFDQEYKARSQAEKVEFEKTFTDRAIKELQEKLEAASNEASSRVEKEKRDALLLISQFLRLAAIRRSDVEGEDRDENKALEGVLTQIYTGDMLAVENMMKLINGVEETTTSVSQETLTTTYADIKKFTIESAPQAVPEFEDAPAVETSEYPVQSDPTIANAGLTEIDEPSATTMTNGHDSHELQGVPQNSSSGDGGNAAAEQALGHSNDLSTSQEWVEIPRDPTETDTGLTATPAAPQQTQSWADDTPDPAEVATAAPPLTTTNDGFHEVQRNRGSNRGDGQGQQRGRGGHRGGDRGRGGYRGEGRGRGRGGQRGGPRGDRGGKRSDES